MSIKLTVLVDQALALLDSLRSESDPLERLRVTREVERVLLPGLRQLRDETAYAARQQLSLADIGQFTGYTRANLGQMVERHAERKGLPSMMYQRKRHDLSDYLDLTGSASRPLRAGSSHPTV